ncbi:MAG: hypothetical protein ACP5UF_04510 [Hydrogenobaculum sp.]
MRQKKNFGHFYSNLIVVSFFLLAVFYTIWNIFISSSNVFSLIALERASSPIEALLKKEEDRYQYLYAKKQQIDENPNFFMKKFATEYMQMQRPNEKIIILPKSLWFKKPEDDKSDESSK